MYTLVTLIRIINILLLLLNAPSIIELDLKKTDTTSISKVGEDKSDSLNTILFSLKTHGINSNSHFTLIVLSCLVIMVCLCVCLFIQLVAY